jgi:hypothetical protein
VVWFDKRGKATNYDEGSVRGVRVSANSTVLDDPDIEIADRVRSTTPVAAFDGTDYFVVWMEDHWPAKFRLSDVYGRRVSTGGVVLDRRTVPIAT